MFPLLDRCRRRWKSVIILKLMIKGKGEKKIWAEKFLPFVKPEGRLLSRVIVDLCVPRYDVALCLCGRRFEET